MLKNRPALKRYLGYYRESRGRIALGVLLSLVRALLVIPLPLLVGSAIDKAIPDKDAGALMQYGGAILGLSLAGAAASMATRYVTVTAIRRAMRRLRDDAVSKLFLVSRRYYTTTEPSVLHDQIVQESSRVNSGTSAVLEQYVPGVALIIGLGVVLTRMNATLALVTLAFGPVIVVTGRLLGRSVRVRVRQQHRSFEAYSRSVLRVLRAMDLIRTHGAEEREGELLAARAEDLEKVGVSRAMWTNAYSVAQATLLVAAAATVLILGGWFVIRGQMTLGDLISFYAGFALLRGPLGGIAQTAPAVIEGMQSLEHLERLLGEPDVRPYSGTRQVDPQRIVVDDVTFAYGAEPVVQGVSLRLDPGRVTAIHGPNGSGKSTLVNLILGFYRPDRGGLSVNGTGYEHIDMVHLRRTVGVVPQQPILLQGTVAENVAYGRDGLTRLDVDAALSLAQADFVHDLPKGVDTDVGGEGVFLSGGQRQRIAIARALVHRPEVLVLDEPTNHLDRQSVTAVIEALASLQPRPAVLLISHQAEVLVGVDDVIELRDGRMVARRGV